MFRFLQRRLFALMIPAMLLCASALFVQAQAVAPAPLTSQELVRLVYQFHDYPQKREEIIGEIRQRGLGFPLTNGLRSVVASKSGNDIALRRTIEEAERRRLNPTSARPPSETETADILAKARTASLAAVEAMPDFVVKQLITRFYAHGNTQNWRSLDRLTLAVSYRASTNAENYKLLAINGLPPGADESANKNFQDQVGGTTSTGEYVSLLSQLFAEDSRTSFKAIDTDTLRNRRTLVYEFEVKLPYSKEVIKAGTRVSDVSTRVGYRGKLWIDRENYRVLRIETIATDIPAGFPVTAASRAIDYDWTSIAERQYLLPSRAEVILTARYEGREEQTRNQIRFRDYNRFGAELKILDDDEQIEDQTAPKKIKP
ncbi:MAG: hypothetical protein ABR577_18205 [Pyrinomonadaceae bacterium]